jgi:hypothetical protein
LRESLGEHDVSTAYERSWSTLKNGDLIDAAEREGFEVLLTTDYSPECVAGEFSEVGAAPRRRDMMLSSRDL